MKRRCLYLLLLLLSILAFCMMSITVAKANEPVKNMPLVVVMKCENPKDLLKSRIRNLNQSLVNVDEWKHTELSGYQMIVFGTAWEEIEETCFAHSAYIETATYTKVTPYMDEETCLRGLLAADSAHLRDSWGGYFDIDTGNKFIDATSTCTTKTQYRYSPEYVTRLKWSERRNCGLTLKHFNNMILDPEYGKGYGPKDWQDMKCRKIHTNAFEEQTGFSVEELVLKLAHDVI